MILLFHVLVCMLNIMLDICNSYDHENCMTVNTKRIV